jgi:hypothetical protein
VGRAVLTAMTFTGQPQGTTNFKTWPIGYIFPLLAVAGPAGVPVELRRKNQLNAFLASCVYLLGMLTSAVFGVYPMVLPARYPTFALTVENAEASDYGLKIGLIWWVIGVASPRCISCTSTVPSQAKFQCRPTAKATATGGPAFGFAVYGRVSHALDVGCSVNSENRI